MLFVRRTELHSNNSARKKIIVWIERVEQSKKEEFRIRIDCTEVENRHKIEWNKSKKLAFLSLFRKLVFFLIIFACVRFRVCDNLWILQIHEKIGASWKESNKIPNNLQLKTIFFAVSIFAVCKKLLFFFRLHVFAHNLFTLGQKRKELFIYLFEVLFFNLTKAQNDFFVWSTILKEKSGETNVQITNKNLFVPRH